MLLYKLLSFGRVRNHIIYSRPEHKHGTCRHATMHNRAHSNWAPRRASFETRRDTDTRQSAAAAHTDTSLNGQRSMQHAPSDLGLEPLSLTRA